MVTAPSVQRVDPVTKVLGNFGKWQLSAMLIVFLCKLPTSWFMAIIIFTAKSPNPGDVWCTPPADLPAEYQKDWISKAHPVTYDSDNISHTNYCNVYTELYNNPLDYFGPNYTQIDTSNFTTSKCTNFTFNPNFHSLVVEFNLVCGRDLLVSLSQCFHIGGLLVGGIVAYFILKHISPRNVMIIGVSAQIIFGNLIGVVRILTKCAKSMTLHLI